MIDSGTVLQGRFLIEDKIGVGGMGAVYRAVDQKFGSRVAIKETFYGDTNLAEAFEREARLLNGLHHAILPHVSDHFTESGGHFLVMEFIEGEDLSEILKRGEVVLVSTALGWALDLLDGLDYLHSQDPPVIHRDIKPNNLKLTSRGKIMLLDFGMAKETSSNTLGAQSVFGYSRRYSPLEQIEGTGTDERSDIFSLGASLYHLVTGEAAVDVLARVSAIVAGNPDPLRPASEVNPEVSDEVAAILSSALSLNAVHRFESARAMSTALEYVISSNAADKVRQQDRMVPVAAAPVVLPIEEQKPPALTIPVDVEGPKLVDEVHNTEPVWFDEGNRQDTNASSDELSPSASAASFPKEAGNTMKPAETFAPVGIRRTGGRNYAVWLPILLLCLGLIVVGAYRGLNADEVQPNGAEVGSTESSEPVEATSDIPATDVSRAAPDEMTATADRTDGEVNQGKIPAVTNTSSTRQGKVDRNRPVSESDADEQVGPTRVRRADRRAESPKAAAERPARKTVRPAFEQPSVSSIEMIMTGVPYERRRRDERRDVWIDDELRERRRMRRMMRRNAPPF